MTNTARSGKFTMVIGENTVEFYIKPKNPERFGPYGQFVGDYHFETFLNIPPEAGLRINLSVPQWTLTPADLAYFQCCLKGHIHYGQKIQPK